MNAPNRIIALSLSLFLVRVAAAQDIDMTHPAQAGVAPVLGSVLETDLTLSDDAAPGGGGSVLAFAQAVEANVQCNGTALQYAALTLDDDGGDTLFIKVQQQPNGNGQFTHIGFYHGNNVEGWPNMTGGGAFVTLDAPFTSAKMTVTHDGQGNVSAIFTEIDGGGGFQFYIRGGWVNRNGLGMGFGAYNGLASIDNWGNASGRVCDNFERANGGLGSNWVTVNGTTSIVNRSARGSSLGRARYVGACSGNSSTIEVDVRANGTGLQYGAVLMDGDGINNLFVKVQQQDNSGRFSHVGFYQGNNSGAWGGMIGGEGIQPLTAKFATARMTVIHNGYGDVTVVFSNIDGGAGRQIYARGGWAPLDGDGIGMGGYANLTSMDNWGGSFVCDDFNRANGPLGGNWSTTDGTASIVSSAARGTSWSRSWFVGTCGGCNDGTPPLVSLSAPAPESCACQTVPIVGSVSDPQGYGGDVLEYRRIDQNTWTQAGSNNNARSGTLYNWNTGGLPSGDYFVRVKAKNACGLSDSAVSIVYVSGAFNTLLLRSPVRDQILAGTACVDGTAWDRCFDEYLVQYRLFGGGQFIPVDPNHARYDVPVITDPLASWNTSGLNDGRYELRVMGSDICGNSASLTEPVIVDNTAPIASITSPVECSCLTGQVAVRGTANDANLASWALQYTGGDTHGWVTIGSGNTAVINGQLGLWNTNGLRPCAYTLRLVVADKANVSCSGDPHQTHYYTSVNVGNCGSGCTGLETLTVKCSNSGKVTAIVKKGLPGQTVHFELDGGQPMQDVLNSKGKGKAIWFGGAPGQHGVSAELGCGDVLNKNVTCP